MQVSVSTEPLNQNTKHNPSCAFNHHTVVTSPPTDLPRPLCPVSLRTCLCFGEHDVVTCRLLHRLIFTWAAYALQPATWEQRLFNTWCFLHPQPLLLSLRPYCSSHHRPTEHYGRTECLSMGFVCLFVYSSPEWLDITPTLHQSLMLLQPAVRSCATKRLLFE